MSKLSDDTKQETAPPSQQNIIISPPPAAALTTGASMRKDSETGRYVFEFNGQKIYEWEQSLDDVTIYVSAPPFVTKGNQLKCNIGPRHLQLGLEGSQDWFLNEDTYGLVNVSESTWSLETDDGKKMVTIYLTKAHRGQLWEAALQGNKAAGVALDPFAKEQVQKDLLLERFQEENPGMDFRGASINGSVPDARTFMGGVTHQ
jgi:hypothetical protein